MREVVALEFLTLDGVMEAPAWTAPYRNDEHSAYAREQLFSADALLLGCVTYEGFAEAWPRAADEQGFAERMNALPKHVASATLQNPGWQNSQVLGRDTPQAVRELKAQPGQDILIYGSAELVRSLTRDGLIDEHRLWIYPIILGKGKRLFADGEPPVNLVLKGTRAFSSGTLALTYGRE